MQKEKVQKRIKHELPLLMQKESVQKRIRLEIVGRSDVVQRRKKLQKGLEDAIKNAEKAREEDPVEAAVQVVEEFRLQELAFDMNFDTAAHLLHVMGVTHCALFGELLVKLQKYFTEGVRSNPHRANLEDFLLNLKRYSLCEGSHQFVRIALETLENLAEQGQSGSRSWISLGAIEWLAEALNSEGESQLDMMPDGLRARIYECKPELFMKKVEPYIIEFVRDARGNHGNLLFDLKSKSPSQRRENNAALQSIKKYVGSQQKLYAIVKKHLVKTFAESPVLRSGCDGEDDDELVSIGPEPFLSTIRSNLLLSFVDDGVLTYSPVSGWWLLEVNRVDGSHLTHYTIHFTQRGAEITGESKLPGVKSVEGSIDGNTLRFRQVSDDATYVCVCQVSQDMRKFTDGCWSFEYTNQIGGSFKACRVGPVQYLDAQGCEWDECAELIVALDHIHQRKYALDDTMSVELPVVVESLRVIVEPQGDYCDDRMAGLLRVVNSLSSAGSSATGISDAGAEDAASEDVTFAARFALVDPCVIQSVCRGLLAGFRELDRSLVGHLDAKGCFSLLFLLVGAQVLVDVGAVSDLKQPSVIGIDAAVVKSCKKPGFALLEKGVPSCDDLAAYGLNCRLIAGFMWYHAQQNLEMETEALLFDALLYAAACRPTKEGSLSATSPAHTVIRIIVNSLVNKCLVVSTSTSTSNQYKLLEESLKSLASHYEKAIELQADSALDCVQQQAVNMIVSSGLRLRELFHLGIRQPVVDHLIFLAKQDAWAHRQALELLQLYRIPNFASAREEITSLRELLQHGKKVWKVHDWTKSLSEAYKSIVESHPFEKGGPLEPGAKSYLAPVYSKSDLGQRYPPHGLHSPQILPMAPPPMAPSQTLPTTPMEAFSLTASVLPPTEPSPLKSKDSGTQSALMPAPLALPESPGLRAEYLGARSELETPDAVMAVDVSHRVRDFCKIRIAAASGVAYDTTPSEPKSAKARRAEKAFAAEASAEAAQLLVTNFQGFHNLALVVAGLVCTLISSRDLPGNASSAEILLRQLTVGTLVSSFRYMKAQSLCSATENYKWIHQFPECREWRTAIYDLMADKMRGHYSTFLTFQLELIQHDHNYQDELWSNVSSIGNFRIFLELFRCAIFRFFDTLKKAGSRKGYNESVMAPAVQEVCRITRYSTFPWIYAQACLHQLMRMRPRERNLLSFLAKATGEVPGENLHRVVNLFTPLPQFPQLFNIVAAVETQRLSGDEIHIRPYDVSVLCGLIQDLLDWKIGSSSPSPRTAADQKSAGAPEDLTDSQKDDATQAASSVAAGEEWFADEPPRESELEGWQAEPSSPSSVGRGRRAKGEKADEVESGTASIWHMRAVSSREAGSEVNNRVGPQSPMAQAAGALDAVRRLPILNDLICQFVDPTVVLRRGEDLKCHTRLLALLTTDGFLQESEDLDGSSQDLDAVASTARATIVELTRIYRVTHSRLCMWAKQVQVLRQLQCSPVASLAGLRWISKVLLKGGDRTTLARVAAAGLGVLFGTLRSAYMQHPSQAKVVLEVIHQLLELAAHKDGLDEEIGSDHGSDDSGRMKDTQGEQRMTGHQVAKLGYDIEQLAASEFVHLTCGSPACFLVLEFLHKHVGTLDKAVMRRFTCKLLPVLGARMSSRMAWAIARLLVHENVVEAVVTAHMAAPLRNFLEICHCSMKMPQADALDGLDILKKRYQETQEATKILEAKLEQAEKINFAETVSSPTTDSRPVSSPTAERRLTRKIILEEKTSILEEKTAELADYFQMSVPVVPKLKKKQASGSKRCAKGKAKSKAKAIKGKASSSTVTTSPPSDEAASSGDDCMSPDPGGDVSSSSDGSEGEDTFDPARPQEASAPNAAAESTAATRVAGAEERQASGPNTAAESMAAMPVSGAEERQASGPNTPAESMPATPVAGVQKRQLVFRRPRRARAETGDAGRTSRSGPTCTSAVDSAGPEHFNMPTGNVQTAAHASSPPSGPAGLQGGPICASAADSNGPEHFNVLSANAQPAASSGPGPVGPICTGSADSAGPEHFSTLAAQVAAPAASPATADATATQASTVESRFASAATPVLATEKLASGTGVCSGEAAAPPAKRKRCIRVKGATRDAAAAAIV